jgi:hypothetical protein
MAREVHKFAVLVPAGTPQNAPLTFELAIPPRVVTELEIIVPPGPRGELGFAVAAAGRAIIPYEPGAFFITDNETIRWPLTEQISSGAWQVVAYNTGAFPHTIEVRFLVDLAGEPAAPSLLPIDALQAPATVSLPPLPPLP